MPTQTYNNPFAGLPESNVPYNGFASGINQSRREATMAPFLGMEQQRQQLDLQKQTQQQDEFMSDPAKKARLSGFEATAAKAGFDIAEARSKMETLPYEERVKVADLRNKLVAAQNQPTTKFMQAAGMMSSQMEKASPEEQQRGWAAFKTRLNMEGIPTPQGFEQWSPEVLNQIKQVGYASVMTPQHLQKMEEEKVKQEGHLAGVRVTAEAGTRNAEISAGASRYGTDQKALTEKPRNIGQEKVRLKGIINSPTASQEEKQVAHETLNSYVTETYIKLLDAHGIALAKGKMTKADVLQEARELEGATAPAHGQSQRSPRDQALQLFGSYEPNKYEYGTNPQTGKFARRPKGK